MKVILHQNMCPNNQLHNGRRSGHCTLFSPMLTCCTALQVKNNTRSISTINPVTMDKSTQPQGSRITLLRIDTLHCQQKELEHKAIHDMCIVHTAVGKKGTSLEGFGVSLKTFLGLAVPGLANAAKLS